MAIRKLMKVMIERENTKRNQSLSRRLKLKEVEEYVKIKKRRCLILISREKSGKFETKLNFEVCLVIDAL